MFLELRDCRYLQTCVYTCGSQGNVNEHTSGMCACTYDGTVYVIVSE